jgi:ABC-2 type transport system ATP-binding protein
MAFAAVDHFEARDPVVRSTGLGKDYGRIRAVDGIDVTVDRGEFFGFLGPNGAGKTTMLHMLTTLLAPTRGSADVAGHDVEREPLAVRRQIGLVFQETTLDPELTARENLRLAGRLYGLGRADLARRIDEVLALFELHDRGNDRVRTFSGGMRRLVDLARGILHRPTVLFLDEPTLGLDPVNRRRVWSFIERLAQEVGTTIFLTTHYLEEADPCDRVVIVDQGRIVAEGTPAELKRNLGGSETVTLTTKGHQPELVAEIARHIGVEPMARSGEIVIAVDSADLVLPALLPLVGTRIETVSIRRPSLDDVFVAVTARDQGGER